MSGGARKSGRKLPTTKIVLKSQSFNLIDLNGDGKISVFEMMSIMNSAGEDVSVEDVEDIFEIVDLDGKLILCI